MNRRIYGLMLAGGLGLAAGFVPSSASACGGFFCSQAAGVNQAAERIVFANNGDGTVTAVIEIQYQGPSDKFSWLLPISSVPEGDQIAVGSGLSFQRLQQATNPQYSLTTRVEGTCDQDARLNGTGGATSGVPVDLASGGEAAADAGVTVEASGVVGSFEWKVISVDPMLAEPADAAVTWLHDNGYDVPPGAPGLLGPYLADGMHLLALRLQKGASSGSIRPIVLTYDAAKPMIPIKLTAVAANDDMGVLAWVLGDAQAVPQNYYGLELNEARINWFNASANYNQVVTLAADEAGGQGFVTEYAQKASSLAGVLWTEFDQGDWDDYQLRSAGPTAADGVLDAMYRFSQWDGFWEVVRKHVTWQTGVTFEQLQGCPDCYADSFVPAADFVEALQTDVITPAQVLQKLLDSHPQVTRLYSTLSAPEMTVDPLFTFNPSLPPVSNVHTAERIIECSRGYYTSDAPWRIELPQGGVVRGGPNDFGVWPSEFSSQPANRRILRLGETGGGKVLEDNSQSIDTAITTYSQSIPAPPRHTSLPTDPDGSGKTTNGDGANNADDGGGVSPGGGSSGCNLAGHRGSNELWLALAGAAVWRSRRRRVR